MKIDYVGKCLLIEEKGERILVIGDLHLGYEEALEKSGTLIGRRMFKEILKEFDKVFEKVGKVNEVVLLGDLKHELSELGKQEREDLGKMFDYLSEKCKKIVAIRGNHDNYLLNLTVKRGIEVKECHLKGDVAFLHGNKNIQTIWGEKIKILIIGHGHPAITLYGKVRKEKYKCFLVGNYKRKKIVIVPSFSEYNEGSDPRHYNLGLAWDLPLQKFHVKIIGENFKIYNFGMLKRLFV